MIRPIWTLMAGFAIWSIAFGALYALQGLGCAWGWSEQPHRLGIIGLWGLTLFATGMLVFWQVRQPRSNPLWLPAIWASVAAGFASIIVFMPSLFASLCI